MINNYKELKLVKREIKHRIHQTEQGYIQQYNLISTFLDLTGTHKGKKNEKNRKHVHCLILHTITEYIKEQKFLSKYKEEYKTLVIPLALTLISSFLVKKL